MALIHDLDKSLEVLIKRELPQRDQVTVSFAAPDDQFSVKLPAVDFFLYDLRENLELRSFDFYDQSEGEGSVSRRMAPIRVDVSYLITAWPGGSGQHGDPSKDEHELLGSVMRTLLRYRTLPLEVLQGSLKRQQMPLPVTTLQPGRLQSLGEFWQALGGKPKAALNYMVTLPVDVREPEVYPRVVEKIIDLQVSNDLDRIDRIRGAS
jgi:hypothetical protein